MVYCWDSHNEVPQAGDLSSRSLFPPSSEAWKSKVRAAAGPASCAPPPWLVDGPLHPVSLLAFPSAHEWINVSVLIRTPVMLGLSLH